MAIGNRKRRLVMGGPPAGPWYDPNALEIDYANGRAAKSGQVYASVAVLLAAIAAEGGVATDTAGLVRIGNYKAPGITNLIVDGAPPDGSTAYTVSGSGATGVATGGEYQLSGGGATNPAAAQGFITEPSKAYEITAELARGTGSVTGNKIAVGTGASLGSTATQSTTATGSSFTTFSRNFASMSSTDTLWAGMVSQGSAVAGFNRFKNLSVKEVWPYSGFTVGSISGRIRAIAPADTSGTKVLIEWDDNAANGSVNTPFERNIVRIVCASGRMRLQVYYHSTIGTINTACNLDLGAVSPGQAIDITYAVTTNLAAAQMVGGTLQTSAIAYMPGIAYMRLHTPQSGSILAAWDNTSTWLTAYNDFRLVPGTVLAKYFLEGDSYPAGYKATFAAQSGRAIAGNPIGGSTMTLIRDRCLAYTTPNRSIPALIHDGDPNGHETLVADEVAKYVAIDDAWIAPIVFFTPLKRENTVSDNPYREDLRVALMAQFGANVIDTNAIAAGQATGSAADLAALAAGYAPPSTLNADKVHPAPPLRDAIVAAAIARFNALGV